MQTCRMTQNYPQIQIYLTPSATEEQGTRFAALRDCCVTIVVIFLSLDKTIRRNYGT